AAPGGGVEALQGVPAHPGVAVGGRGGSEPPERPSPPVAVARLVLPAPIVAEPVVAPPVRRQGMGDEGQIALGKLRNLRRGMLLAADDDKAAGHIVDAVAAPPPWDGAAGVLQQARVVAHPEQVGQGGGGSAQVRLTRRLRPQRSRALRGPALPALGTVRPRRAIPVAGTAGRPGRPWWISARAGRGPAPELRRWPGGCDGAPGG